MSQPESGFDGCSCPKGEGCWGQDGWHLFRMTVAEFPRHYFDRETRKLGFRELTDERRRQIRLAGERLAPIYAGLAFAYEPCPHFQQVARDNAAARTRSEMGRGFTQRRMRVVAPDSNGGAS